MTIKRGKIVCHAGAIAWGVGKVMEVADFNATIQFSDGIIRKIASTHYTFLQPADPGSFVPIPDKVLAVKVRATPKRVKKVKQPVV